MNQELKLVVKHFEMLAKKHKIVYVQKVFHDKGTPKDIHLWLVCGNTGLRLRHEAFYDAGLRTMTCKLGRLNGERIIVYHLKHEAYVKDLIKQHAELLKQYNELKKDLDEFASEIRRFGDED